MVDQPLTLERSTRPRAVEKADVGVTGPNAHEPVGALSRIRADGLDRGLHSAKLPHDRNERHDGPQRAGDDTDATKAAADCPRTAPLASEKA